MRSALALRRVTTMGASASRVSYSSLQSLCRLPTSNSRSNAAVKTPFTIALSSRRRQNRSSFFSVSAAAASTSSSNSDEDDAFARFAESQRKLPRPTLAEEARTILASAGTAVLSTADARAGGHPAGSVVQFALLSGDESDNNNIGDDNRRRRRCSAVLALSSMSSHTRDLAEDPRCSLTVLAPGFKGMEDSRVSLTCVAKKLGGGGSGNDATTSDAEEESAARAAFKQRHPDAFWVDFGDFSWWRLDPVGDSDSSLAPPAARVVAGFGRAGNVSSAELASASADPVAAFSGPVAGHMNADHADAVLAVAKSSISIAGLADRIERATMGKVDRLGFEVELVLSPSTSGEGGEEKASAGGGGGGGERLTARIPFPQPAEDRKALKERLVEMTRAAAAAAAASKSG